MSLQEFETLLNSTSMITVGGGASHETIEAAEQSIGMTFPPTYRTFLSRFGWAIVWHMDIYGLGELMPPHLDVVSNTKIERELAEPSLPLHLIPIMNDGAGNHFCIDTSRIRENEMAIVFWDHEDPMGTMQTPEIVGTNFGEWIAKKASTILSNSLT